MIISRSSCYSSEGIVVVVGVRIGLDILVYEVECFFLKVLRINMEDKYLDLNDVMKKLFKCYWGRKE